MGRAAGRAPHRPGADAPLAGRSAPGSPPSSRRDDPAYQFDTADGRSIGGRHFTVRFARLTLLPGQPRRCLVSLIDKTAQVETEKSLRSEMLRDSLTGLPNRFAFNEKVEAVLADPASARAATPCSPST